MPTDTRRARPVRRPPSPGRAPGTSIVNLPVLTDTPPLPAQPAEAPQTPAQATLTVAPPGDPFNPHKILNHFDLLQAVALGQMVFPITVEIDPTNICNHRCRWCVSTASHTGEELDLETIHRLACELRDCDVRSVVLKGGGEPTVHPQFCEILDILRKCRLSTGLITNGSIPRPGSLEKISETCAWVRVSLDAATAETHQLIHGTRDFARIVRNVKWLACHGAGLLVGLNFVAEPRNYLEIVPFVRLARSLGAAYVTIRCVFDPANPIPEEIRAGMRQQALQARQLDDGHFRVFLGNFADQYLNARPTDPFPYARCLGPNLIGIVGADGEVYACCFLRGNRDFSFGNLKQQSFRTIWTSPQRQRVMRAVYAGQCNRACAGGMTANRYNLYNEILNYLAAEEKMHWEFA